MRSEDSADALRGRLHPATLVFTIAGLVRGAFFPLVVALFAGRRVAWYLWAVLGFAGLSLLWAVARYFTFTYGVEGGELVLRHGLVGRQERHIPLSRVQDVRLEQSVAHRLFGVVKVDIETAGGGGASEASLSVLSVAEAERLRRAIFAQAPGFAPGEQADGPSRATPAALLRPQIRGEGETLWQVPLKDLVLAGLTANHLGTVLAVLFGALALVDDLLPEESEKQFYGAVARLLSRGLAQAGAAPWVVIAAAVAAGLAAAALLSVAGSILLYFGFRLSRGGEDLHRDYGLLTKRASRLPRRRIQVLKVEEEFLRRLLGLATLRADTAGGGGARAGSQQEAAAQGGRDVLIPVLPRAAVPALLPQFFPDLDPEPEAWRRVSPRAVRREALPGMWVSLLLSAGLTAVLWGVARRFPAFAPLPSLWWGALPLLLVPVSIVSSVLNYRHLGYALGARYFRARRGALSRSEHVVPLRNVQAVVLRQTPFDRRHRLARLQIDSAGQVYTGGGPQIEHLPLAEALVLARTLAHEAERQRYHWER